MHIFKDICTNLTFQQSPCTFPFLLSSFTPGTKRRTADISAYASCFNYKMPLDPSTTVKYWTNRAIEFSPLRTITLAMSLMSHTKDFASSGYYSRISEQLLALSASDVLMFFLWYCFILWIRISCLSCFCVHRHWNTGSATQTTRADLLSLVWSSGHLLNILWVA